VVRVVFAHVFCNAHVVEDARNLHLHVVHYLMIQPFGWEKVENFEDFDLQPGAGRQVVVVVRRILVDILQNCDQLGQSVYMSLGALHFDFHVKKVSCRQ